MSIEARQLALEALYEADQRDLDDYPLELPSRAARLVEGVLDNLGALDAEIEAVAEHWQVHRMPVVDRAILRLGLYELRFERDTPKLRGRAAGQARERTEWVLCQRGARQACRTGAAVGIGNGSARAPVVALTVRWSDGIRSNCSSVRLPGGGSGPPGQRSLLRWRRLGVDLHPHPVDGDVVVIPAKGEIVGMMAPTPVEVVDLKR